MKKAIPNLVRCLICVMMISLVVMEIFWTPRVTEYALSFVSDESYENIIRMSAYIASALILLLSLTVCFISFKFATCFKNDTVFTPSTAKDIKIVACLVSVDCLILAFVSVILFLIGDGILAPALAFFDIIGIAIAATLFVLSRYLKEAAELKEEVDCTL